MVVISINDMESKRMMGPGIRQWMEDHSEQVLNWVMENLSEADREPFISKMMADEMLLYAMHMVLEQAGQSPDEKLAKVITDLSESSGKLWIVVGGKRKGKTAFIHIIGENYKRLSKRPVWWYGPPAILPDYIDGQTMDLNAIPPGALVLVDEASIQLFARVHDMTSTDFIKRLPVIAHHDHNYIFCTQSSSISDINICRLADAIIWKSYSVIQGGGGKMDRLRVSDQLKMFMPQEIKEVLYFDNQRLLLFDTPLPEWWTDEYSKPYAPFRNKAEFYRFTLSMMGDGVPLQKAIEMVGIRGKRTDQLELEEIRMLGEFYGISELLSSDDVALTELMEAGFDDTPIMEQHKGKFRKIKGDFKLPPLDEESDNRRQRNDVEYALMCRRNINRLFISNFQYRVEHKGNIVISVIGLRQQTTRGTGKSWCGLSLGEFFNGFYGKKFPAKNVKFDDNEVLEAAKTIKEMNTLARDENKRSDRTGAGSGAIKMEGEDFRDTIRRRQINLIYSSPDLRIHDNDIILEAYGIDHKLRIARFLVYQHYPGLPLGYITVDAPKAALVKEYEEMREKFQDEINARETMMMKIKTKAVASLSKDEKYSGLKNKGKRLAYIRKHFPELRTASVQEEVMNEVEIENL